MVQEGIVLEHKVSERGIEVDRAKIEVIEQLPPPINVKGIRSFLGHAGFYRCFIKTFLKSLDPSLDCWLRMHLSSLTMGAMNLLNPETSTHFSFNHPTT